MARGRAHDDQTRASVMAALLAGQAISEVARQYRLPEGTVHTWARQLHGVQPKNEEEFSELIADCLRTFLSTLRIQAGQCQDTDWIKKQPASELAVFFGVLADKTFRILEAADSARQQSEILNAGGAGDPAQ
jgi:hypothetical protein